MKNFQVKNVGIFPFTCLTARLVHFEQSLNTRPFVPASADATDWDVLTPNHFLLGTAGSALPSNLSCNSDHGRRNEREQAFSDAMWNRWLREYVATMNRQSQWSCSADRDLKTGNLVCIIEATIPGGHYSLARVVKLNYSSDAFARSAEVKTEFFHCPFDAVIQKLFILLL